MLPIVMNESKAALRRRCLALRKTLPGADAHIAELLLCTEFKNAKNVFCYVSAGSEIGTHLLLSEILRSGKTLLVPRCTDENGNMCAVRIKSLHELKAGHFGIYEPESTMAFSPIEIDAAVVPAVAYEKTGARLGMGKGYYDRFLKKAAAAYKIGLIHRELVVKNVYAGIYDIAVNKIIQY